MRTMHVQWGARASFPSLVKYPIDWIQYRLFDLNSNIVNTMGYGHLGGSSSSSHYSVTYVLILCTYRQGERQDENDARLITQSDSLIKHR